MYKVCTTNSSKDSLTHLNSQDNRLLLGAISFGNLRGDHFEDALVQFEDLLFSAARRGRRQLDWIAENEDKRIFSVSRIAKSEPILFLGETFGQINTTHHATCNDELFQSLEFIY